MKRSILKKTAVTVLVIALAHAPASSHGQEPAAPATQATTNPEAGPQKFYGTISAIDTKANTFTVDNQTYSIIAETHMTKAADDKAATLADAVVGEPARGTYTKSSDGKLNVTKVRFGKKAGGGKASGKKSKEATTQPQEK